MKSFLSGSIGALFLLTVLSSCQSIPEAPLALESHLRALGDRIPAPEPVLDYARLLAEARGETPAPFDIEDGISLREAEAIALWYNADLRMERLDVERTAALAATAGRWEDPDLSIASGRKRVESEAPDSARVGGAGPPIDIERSWISAASLSITVPISGRLGAERRARAADHEAARLAVAEQEWETLRKLQELWLHWSAALERRRLLDEHLRLVEQFHAIAQALAEAGELEPGGARMLLIERAQKEALRTRVSGEADERRSDILHLLGLLPGAPVDLAPALTAGTDSAPDVPESHAWVLDHPALARLRGAYEAAEAHLGVELKKQYPDLTFSPAVDSEDDESSITLGLGFPIPVWNANRPGIAEAAADRDRARARAEAMIETLLADYARAESRRASARQRRERLAADAGPAVDQQMAEAQALLRIGEADPGLLFQALGQAIAVKLEILEASEEESVAAAQVAALVRPRCALDTNLESQQ